MRSPLPSKFLKNEDKWRRVKLLDAAILLWHVWRGAAYEDVGWEDSRLTLNNLTNRLFKKLYLSQSQIESCLWSCNLLNEKGQFWHPQGLSFDQFVADMMPGLKFDKRYNFFWNEEDGKK